MQVSVYRNIHQQKHSAQFKVENDTELMPACFLREHLISREIDVIQTFFIIINKLIDLSYYNNDVKRGKPIYAMSHRTMQLAGERIHFIKTLYPLRVVAK